MKHISVLLICVLLLGAGSASYAVETVNRATGLPGMPSADVIPYKEYAMALDYGGRLPEGAKTLTNTLTTYKLDLGMFPGVEAGIVGGTDDLGKYKEGVFLNLKLSLSAADNSSFPLKLALGAENITSANDTNVYMVATKYLNFYGPKSLHFGFMGDFPGEKFRPLGMLGMRSPFLGQNIYLLGDLLAGETVFQVDAGIRIYLLPGLAINITGLNLAKNPDETMPRTPKSVYAGISWQNPF